MLPRSSKQVKRRSVRVQLRIPITVEVSDESVMEAETVTVSKHGAKIRIMGFRRKLACGEKMRIATRPGQQSQTARVVWQDKRAEPHYGIELEDAGNFWGVYFPSKDGDDWRKTPRKAPQPAAAPVTPVVTTAATQVVPPPPEPPPASDVASVSALVTGVSAARMPMAERTDVVFTRPDEASALLRHLVEPGASLRLILPDERIMMGRVSAVGAQRQAGKWQVRIKCEALAV
jgi:hypothetical protein